MRNHLFFLITALLLPSCSHKILNNFTNNQQTKVSSRQPTSSSNISCAQTLKSLLDSTSKRSIKSVLESLQSSDATFQKLAGDLQQDSWLNSNPYLSRFKGMKNTDGGNVTDIDSFMRENDVPQSYRKYYRSTAANENGEVIWQEDIKKTSAYLAPNNSAENIAGGKDNIAGVSTLLSGRYSTEGSADLAVERVMQDIHKSWRDRNISWASSEPENIEDLSPGKQYSNFFPLLEAFNYFSRDIKHTKTYRQLIKALHKKQQELLDAKYSEYKDMDLVDIFMDLVNKEQVKPQLSQNGLINFFNKKVLLRDFPLKDTPPQFTNQTKMQKYLTTLVNTESYKSQLGADIGDIVLKAPDTPAGSGAVVYLLKDDNSGAIVGALKVMDSDKSEPALEEILGNLTVESIYEGSEIVTVKSHVAGRIPNGPYIILQSAAKGRDIDTLLKNTPKEDQKQELIRSAAQKFAVLHNLGPDKEDMPKGLLQIFQDNVTYDTYKLSDFTEAIDESSDAFIMATQSGLSSQKAKSLKQSIDSITKRYIENITNNPTLMRPSRIHGDAHGGNIFIEQDNLEAVAYIDVADLTWSLTKDGYGISDPANDIARFLGQVIVNNLKSKKSPEDSKALIRDFIALYSEKAGIDDPKQLEVLNEGVSFHLNRYFAIQAQDVEGVKFNCGSVPNCDDKELRSDLFEFWSSL